MPGHPNRSATDEHPGGRTGAADGTAARRSGYPGYDVLAKRTTPDWDAPTRALIHHRLNEVPPIRFLTADEVRVLEAVTDRLIPQADRAADARVPIVPWIDEKLHHDRRDGYRYEDLPPLREAWRQGLTGLDETARLLHGRPFADLEPQAQNDTLSRVQRGDPPGSTWSQLSAARFFRDVLCLTVVRTYYAHPAAWSEIGYSGPSAVRGHFRNWMGGVDPWDAPEK